MLYIIIINGYIIHTANDGCRLPMLNRYIKLNLSSTLEDSVLILTCENENLMSSTNVLEVICHSTATSLSWNPDPTDFIESCSSITTTVTLPAGSPACMKTMWNYSLEHFKFKWSVLLEHTETHGQNGSNTSTGIILGSVLGVLFGVMAVIITITVILCLIKKGINSFLL